MANTDTLKWTQNYFIKDHFKKVGENDKIINLIIREINSRVIFLNKIEKASLVVLAMLFLDTFL